METNNTFNDFEKEGSFNMYTNQNFPSNYNIGSNSNYNTNFMNQQNYAPPSMMPQNNQIYNNINAPLIQNNINNNDFGQGKNILYISDLPYNTNETDIKLFFKKYGDDFTLMPMNNKNSYEGDTASLSAKVIFKDPIIANQARKEMNLRKLKGHAIRLMWDEKNNSLRNNPALNLFVKGIPFNVQPREVYEYFFQFGDISSIKIKEDSEGNHLGYGYVTYYDPRSAEIAIKNTDGKMMWGGGPIQVDHFRKKNERISTAGPEVFKINITNFPGDFTKDDIVDLTKEFGNILDVSINTLKIGRKYALICFDSEESAIRAKESLEGKSIRGYNLLCKIVNDKINPNDIPPKKFKNNFGFNNNMNNYQNNKFSKKTEHIALTNEQRMCNLHIKNIPFTIKEKEFNEIFSKYGKIVSSKLETYNLITHYGGQFNSVPTSKGFGYVCYEDPEIAKKVKNELDKHFLPGYEHWKEPLAINFFVSKSQKAFNSMNMNYIDNNNINNINNTNDYTNNMINKYEQTNGALPEFNLEKFNSFYNEEEKKNYLGDYIYSQTYSNPLLKDFPDEEKKRYDEKITGMILCCETLDKVAEICNNKENLEQMISKSFNMINESKHS